MNGYRIHSFVLNWGIIIIILLSVTFRFYQLGYKCFWADERFSLDVCNQIRYDDTTPDLYYTLNKPFLSLPFSAETDGRILSAILGVFTVLLIYLIGKNLFGKWFGLLIGFISAVNPILIIVSRELRAYSMITFLLSLLFLSFFSILKITDTEKRLNSKRVILWFIVFAVAGIAGIYTHYIMIPALCLTALAFGHLWINSCFPGKDFKYPGAAFVLIGIGFLFHLNDFLTRISASTRHTVDFFVKIPSMKEAVKSIWEFNMGPFLKFIWLTNKKDIFDNPLNIIIFCGTLLLIPIFIRGLWKLFKLNNAFKIISTIFVLFYFSSFFLEWSSPRQAGGLLILYIIILGYGFYTLRGIKLALASILFIFVTSGSLFLYYRMPYQPMGYTDWRAAGEYLKENVKPGDVVYSPTSDLVYLLITYYYDGKIIPLDERTELIHITPQNGPRLIEEMDSTALYAAESLKKLFRENNNVFVLMDLNSDKVVSLATDNAPESEVDFGETHTPFLIRKYSKR